MIDDSDSVSWQMLLDQIDTMWVKSIWLFTDREDAERRCVQGRVEEDDEQTDEETDGKTEQTARGHMKWRRHR